MGKRQGRWRGIRIERPARGGCSVMPPAFSTDIRRTITGNLKRFISLFVITALGATLLVGLKAACDDLRFTADSYYDEQHLFDVSVQSTLGLDDEDVAALAELDGVEVAEGGYSELGYTEVDGSRQKVDLRALSRAGLNEPRVLEGRLPRDVDEVAVTQKYLDASGKHIGDTVTFEGAEETERDLLAPDGADGGADAMNALDADADAMGVADADAAAGADAADADAAAGGVDGGDDDAAAADAGAGTATAASTDAADATSDAAIFARGTYTITGAVLDPMDVNAGSKTMSFRSSGGSQYAFFFTPGAVADRETYTVAYLTVAGAADLMTYSDAYQERVDEVKRRAEQVREEREAARTEAVKGGILDAIEDEQESANAQLADAQGQIDDALAQVDAGSAQLAEQGASAEEQLAAAQQQLDASRKQVDAAMSSADMLASMMGDAWPADAWARLQGGDASAKAAFTSAIDAYVANLSERVRAGADACDQLSGALGDLPAGDAATKERVHELLDELVTHGYLSAEDAARMGALVDAYPENEEQIVQLQDEVAQTKAGILTLSDQLPAAAGQADMLADAALSARTLASAQAELDAKRADAQRQLADGRAKLEAGAAQAAAGQAELDAQRADADAQFANARRDVEAIEAATWYIQDRTALPSYASVASDASSIESIATVFPLIFFTVAVLISLTTVTRMVEEDRGLIGVYKALGYSRAQILAKYLVYAFSACLAGGLAGDALGFIVLPEVIFTIFRTMYALPAFQLHYNPATAALSIALFAIGIVGATFLACRHVLKETPASLMRPKAPRAGKRILLERITPVWRRLSFLNKVSARNLFRYKKRFLMTVFGIAGCTALMICGLGIRDTVISLKPRQYGDTGIARYDLMAVTADADFAAGERELRESGMVEEMLEARIDTVSVGRGGATETAQLMVVPDGADLAAYLKMQDGSHTSFLLPATDGAELSLPSEGTGVLVTKNLEQVLGFSVGDELTLQDATFRTGAARADGITVSFLGNFVFMTESAYEAVFGEPVVPNAFVANLAGTDAQQTAFVDELAEGNTFVSVNGTAKIADSFGDSFKIVDVVVYVVTVMAGALAFAVVFTLSNTNISERERELATIKVLGFRRREVYRYINKETIILTLIGIVAGWPLGYLITRFLTYVLRMPSLFFDTIVEPQTYVFASVMSLVFTLIINRVTNRSLDKIDMVGALKSAE